MYFKFGPNVVSLEEIKSSLDFSDEAVELSFTRTDKVFYDEDAIGLLRKFKYKSIHMPVLNHGNFISYPDSIIDNELTIIDKIIEEIDPNTVLFHPDQMVDFKWVREKYGNRLAFENIDARKMFGKTVDEMAKVFELCPNAKFVLDVNHVYTNDKTMILASDLYLAFKDRLTHYHLSGLSSTQYLVNRFDIFW